MNLSKKGTKVAYEYHSETAVHGRFDNSRQLTGRLTVSMAWSNIRSRIGRSVLVTSGVVLAIAFLTYILAADALGRSVVDNGSPALLEMLKKKGVVDSLTDADARIQTLWMVWLALLVSFVGILNSMLLSVTERYAEIGTMKCLGALDRLVVELFVLESIFQGIVGTTSGIVIGLSLAVGEGLNTYGADALSLAPWGSFGKLGAMCLIAGMALTIVATLYPAWSAARMKPIEAMRADV